ncbi:m-phase inducer phosphatase [Tritrichomonas musculus]|uniref:protein-tyrosine-phosphatase n=1 Tax=Tritrichomonas musculus TaxID=1915356 RepID=A0ABR2JPX0_9EUKA
MSDIPKDPEIETLDKDETRISHETFCKLFDDHSKYEHFYVIDCRSFREYNGGHIKGAIRCNPFEDQSNIPDLYDKYYDPKSIFIFHCEYSIFRGPFAWKKFTDEHSCSNNYKEPLNAFILDGGYRQFYPLHQDYCDGRYIPEFS